MKDILGTIGRYLSYIFAVLVIGYTAALTFMVAGRLVPGNLWLQLMTVMLFDGAALVWAIMFVTQAKGTTQWAYAGIGFVIGLLGAILMAAGELILGQNLVVFNDPQRLGWILISAVITACVTHVTLIYLFHFSDPAVKNRIEMQQKIAAKVEKAHLDARERLDRETAALTAGIADSVIEHAKMYLEGEIGVNVRDRNRRAVDNSKLSGVPPILEGFARDTPAAAHPGNSGKAQVYKYNPAQDKRNANRGPRPQSVPFGNNGGSAEHNAFAAAPAVTAAQERNSHPTPPPSSSNPST